MTDLEEAQERIAACRRDHAPTLTLERLQLGTIPDEVFKLTWLKELNVYSCGLTELSPKFADLKNLQSLDAHNTKLSALSPEIGQLASLTTLILATTYWQPSRRKSVNLPI